MKNMKGMKGHEEDQNHLKFFLKIFCF